MTPPQAASRFLPRGRETTLRGRRTARIEVEPHMSDDRQGYDDKLGHILRTAAGVFAEKGYHQASIRDISRATGVSLSGLYYYFRSKEELLFLIQDHCFGTVLANLDRLLEGVSDPRRRLYLLVENHLRFFVNNMKEMKVLSHEADALTGEYRTRVNAKKRLYVQICAGIIRQLRPPEGGMTERTLVFALFGMMNWVYNWYRPDRDVPVARLAAEMSRLFMEGCLGLGPGESAGTGEGLSEPLPSIWRH